MSQKNRRGGVALFKKGTYNRIVSFAGLILVATGILAAVIMFLLRYEEMWRWYDITAEKLAQLEVRISEIPQKFLFVFAVWLLFFIKCFVPIYPTSTVCFLTALVLPVYLAVPVNIVGLSVMLSFKYFWGYRFGGGMAWQLISKSDGLRRLIQQDGNGSPLLLVLLRLVPGVPIGSVSTIYGSMNFKFDYYIFLSILGFMPRLISFTIVGRNAYDPLSVGFLLPLMLVSTATGITMLSVNGGIVIIERILRKNDAYEKKKAEKKEERKAK